VKAPTLAQLKRMAARANDLRLEDVTITWVVRPRKVTFPTGHVEMTGTVRVAAPGFRTTVLPVSTDDHGTWFGR
jgi:hypothetical protein